MSLHPHSPFAFCLLACLPTCLLGFRERVCKDKSSGCSLSASISSSSPLLVACVLGRPPRSNKQPLLQSIVGRARCSHVSENPALCLCFALAVNQARLDAVLVMFLPIRTRIMMATKTLALVAALALSSQRTVEGFFAPGLFDNPCGFKFCNPVSRSFSHVAEHGVE